MLRVLPELDTAEDDDTLNKVKELIFRMMDEHISTTVIIGSVALTLGVLLTDYQINLRFTLEWTSSRGVANRRGEVNMAGSYREMQRLQKIIDDDEMSPEARNDTRHIFNSIAPHLVTDELVEDCSKGRELSIDDYKAFIGSYGEVVGCGGVSNPAISQCIARTSIDDLFQQRGGCFYTRANIKKTNITSEWFESPLANAMNPEWAESIPSVRCRSCARTEVFLIE